MAEHLCPTCIEEGRTSCWFLEEGETIQKNVEGVADRLGVTSDVLAQARVDSNSLTSSMSTNVGIVYDASNAGGRQIEAARQKARGRLCRRVNDRVFNLPGQ